MPARALPFLLLLACQGRADRDGAREDASAAAFDETRRADVTGATPLPPIAGRTPEIALLLGHARLGEPLAPGWLLVDADARPGSITLTLQADDGKRTLVEVFRRGTEPLAPVVTDSLELYVMDGSNSNLQATPTDCTLVSALDALVAGATDPGAHARLAARLLTRAERRVRYPALDLPEATTPPPLPPALGIASALGAPVPQAAPGAAPMPLSGPRLVDVPITPFPAPPPPASVGPIAPGAPGYAAAPLPSPAGGPGTVPAESQITSGPAAGKTPEVTTTHVPPPPGGWAGAPSPEAPTTGVALVPPAPAAAPGATTPPYPQGTPVPAPPAATPGVTSSPVPPTPAQPAPAPTTKPPGTPG